MPAPALTSYEKAVCTSVRSVCPSVKRVLCKKTERSVQIFIPHERSLSLFFSEKKNGWWGDSFYLKFWVKLTPFERNRRFSVDIRPVLIEHILLGVTAEVLRAKID